MDSPHHGTEDVSERHVPEANHPKHHSELSLRRSWGDALILCLAGIGSIAAVDSACSAYFMTHRLQGDIRDVIQMMEYFGTPYGALLILFTSWFALPDTRRLLVRTFSCAAVAGLIANGLKLCISRTRPAAFEFGQSIWSSFQGVGRWGAGGSLHQGFPSGHTAFAFGFAVMLGELFPNGRRWFYFLAAMVGFQRVAFTAHFPSDVLVGAAVGLITGRYYAGGTGIAALCERIEIALYGQPSNTTQATLSMQTIPLSSAGASSANPNSSC